jgi:NADP-dependent 3-hydroxy acid dehydrogenase YdfG/acyl carrier protein
VLSLGDGARIVSVRAHLIGARLSGRGKVLSATASVQEIGPLPDDVSVAAVNGPNSVTLSGAPAAMDVVADRLAQAGITCRWVDMDFAGHSAQMEQLRVPLLEQLADISPRKPEIPMMSTVDGCWVADPVDAGYWVRNLREPVRFGDAIEALAEQGFGVFVECSSHPVLTTAVQDTVGDDAVVVGTLRRDQGDRAQFLQSLAELFVRGVAIAWPWRHPTTTPVPVPTSVFQHEHFWLEPAVVADAAGLGQAAVPHPVLRAAVENPDTGGVVLTGRLGLGTHSWLADHAIAGTVLMPGAALVEFAIQGGDRVGTPVLDELVIEAPMLVLEDSALHVQVTVGVAEEATSRRTVAIHSRPDRGDAEWIRHATGFLTDDTVVAANVEAPWPPEGAQPVEVGDLYDTLSARGYDYGPVFQGLNRAWRRDGELFAEVTLPPQVDATGFVIHPALLDAALHTSFLGTGTDDGVALPFAWNRVVAHAVAAGTVRVRSTSDAGGGVAIELTDSAGEPVLSVGSLVSRPISADQFAASANSQLFGVNWSALPVEIGASVEAALITGADDLAAFAVGHTAPWLVLRSDPGPVDEADPARARAVVDGVLATLQAFLTEPAWVDSRLVVTTRLGVATESAEVPDPVAAAVWGLVRAAHTEHPGRVLLADLDTEADLPLGVLDPVVAVDEWQIALRGDRVLVPRLAIVADPGENPTRSLDPDGTVVITGGTGTLGSLVAWHLVTAHGVRSLVVASRRGPSADHAAELVKSLEELGARVEVVACDVADRDQVRDLLSRVPVDAPLTGVVHTAGVLDDGVITALEPHRIDRVFGPKVDAAVHLDELTREFDLAAFVIFSSASGILGNAGQGNYAAANTFLDALAIRRRAAGYPAVSLAWGLWAEASGMTEHLDTTRMARSGIKALEPAAALRMLDAGLSSSRPVLVPLGIDLAGLRAHARSNGAVPPILRGLVGSVRRATASVATALPSRLAGLDRPARLAALAELVRTEAAAELGHRTTEAITQDRPFRELGFDSLTAVGLRNRLTTATGRRLPATLIYDHETPGAVAHLLLSEMDTELSPDRAAERGVAEHTIGEVYRTLLAQGRDREMQLFGASAAATRPTFDSAAELDGGARIVRLAKGDEGPHLICFAPLAAMDAVMNFSRLANQFHGVGDLSLIVTPGYAQGEPLASGFDVLVTTLADAVLRCADGGPFALLGISAGGVLANSVAAHLEGAGTVPAGVALIDTYVPEEVSPRLLRFLSHQYATKPEFDNFEFDKITASSAYTQMLQGWRPTPLAAPTLVLRPTRPLAGPAGPPLAPREWRAHWPVDHIEVTVPGDHFSLSNEDVATTADAVRTWLAGL